MKSLIFLTILFTSNTSFAWHPGCIDGVCKCIDTRRVQKELNFYQSLGLDSLSLLNQKSQSKKSAPFFLSVTGRVCSGDNNCTRYNGDSGNFTIDIFGNSGLFELEYDIEGVEVRNNIHLHLREDKIEIYIEIKDNLNSLSKTGTSMLVPSLNDLHWTNISGAGFKAGDKVVYPEIVIGPAVR